MKSLLLFFGLLTRFLMAIIVILALWFVLLAFFSPSEMEATNILIEFIAKSHQCSVKHKRISVEEDVKKNFYSACKNGINKYNVTFVTATGIGRYDFVINRTRTPFIITMSKPLFMNPKIWVHRYGLDVYLELIEESEKGNETALLNDN